MSAIRALLVVSRNRWSALALAALAGAATVACGVALFGVSGWLIARASEHPDEVALAVAVVAVRALGIGRGFFRYLERLLTHDAAFRSLVDLRVRLWRSLVRAFPAGLGDRHSGDVVSRLVGDVDAVQDLLIRGVTPPVVAALVGGAAVGVLAVLDGTAGVVLAIGLLAAALVVPAVSVLASHTSASRTAADRGALSAGVTDLVDGLDELVAYGADADTLTRLATIDDRLVHSQRRWAWAGGAAAGLGVAVAGATLWAMLAVVVAAGSHGSLSRTSAAVLVLTAIAAFEATTPLAAAAQQLMAVRASARRVVALLDAPAALRPPRAPRSRPLPHIPHIRLRNVSLQYAGSLAPAVSDLSLDLQPGKRVALVGPSGAGKSSVASLLLWLREPSAGTIEVDGTPMENLDPDEVRSRISGCLADSHIFDSTIRANLLLARPDADQSELDAVADAVHLREWIETQPLGWDTNVGIDGVALSGGERQRLALARVLLTDAGVVVLDEPTAHLDPATRDAVLTDVLAATRGRTLVLITHDPTGLDELDEIVHLDHGLLAGRTLVPHG